MTPLLALLSPVLHPADYLILAGIVAVIVAIFATSVSFTARQRMDLRRLERKLDALLQHQGVEPPPGLSAEVQTLARDPSQKLAAIGLHRKETGLGFEEAKAEVEAFLENHR